MTFDETFTDGKWVSVKDSLPEPGIYLCYYLKRMAFLHFNGSYWKNTGGNYPVSSVTHWHSMTVPDLPDGTYIGPDDGKGNHGYAPNVRPRY